MTTKQINAKEACEILDITPKLLKELNDRGITHPIQISAHKKFYLQDEIEEIQKDKEKYEFLKKKEPTVSPRNTLNDLTGTEWLPETKSFFFQKGLGSGSKEAQIEKLHPAPFSFQDINRLITFFTKKDMVVLDPFGGVGSTAKACELTSRKCVSVELSPRWHNLAIERLETEVNPGSSKNHTFINGDCIEYLNKTENNTFDFIVTSPPYWSILNKKIDHKTKIRESQNLETHYSESTNDLGNIEDYELFLDTLVEKVFIPCGRVLKPTKYMALVISDFRNNSEYISFHSDLIVKLKNRELPDGCLLRLQGTKVLLQNHKSLLPYGYPASYVENIHHQYILIFRKEQSKNNKVKGKCKAK